MIESIRLTTQEYLMDVSAITEDFNETITRLAQNAAADAKTAGQQFNQELKDRTQKYIEDLKKLNESAPVDEEDDEE